MSRSRLVEEMHRSGINLRHCGRVRRCMDDPFRRQVLLTEMVARVLKNKLNSLLRQKMQQQRLPLQIPYRRVILRFLNILCGQAVATADLPNAHQTFWSTELKNLLLKAFPMALLPEEQHESFDLRENLNPCHLFMRLQEISALKLSAVVLQELAAVKSFRNLVEMQFRFVPSDLMALQARVKHMNVVGTYAPTQRLASSLCCCCADWQATVR